jgi:Cu/Ag efflux pump CusA
MQQTQKTLGAATRYTQRSLPLAAIILTVIVWAVAANVANSLSIISVHPLERYGASSMVLYNGVCLYMLGKHT